jgi:hypothetical protein
VQIKESTIYGSRLRDIGVSSSVENFAQDCSETVSSLDGGHLGAVSDSVKLYF